MYAITTEDGRLFFSEHDIKEQTAMYYQKLYTPKILPADNHLWIYFIEKQIAIFGENKHYEKEYYNREITVQQVDFFFQRNLQSWTNTTIVAKINDNKYW